MALTDIPSFDSFYQTAMLPALEGLETERKAAVKRLKTGILIFIAVTALSLYFGSMFPILLAGVGMFFFYRKEQSAINDLYKGQVIAALVRGIDPTLQYRPGDKISNTDYHGSKLYLDSINRYNGDDLIIGKIDKTAFYFSELHTQMVTKSGKETHVHNVFRGIFFVADFNKNFSGETFVLPDTAEKLFGSFGSTLQKMNMSRPQLVKLENPEFEKAFAVYGTDQVEARYILSPMMMERILGLKGKTQADISLSFVASKMYLGIPLTKNLFEAPGIWASLANKDRLEEYYYYLRLCLGIVHDMDLNTRIWTKE